MADPNAQTPTPDELLRPGIDRLVELRPRALAQINYGRGRYSHVFAGWRAQAALMVQRLADYAKNGRLSFAEADALRELAASEFDTLSDLEPATAVGHVRLARIAGTFPGGTFRQGTRFLGPADTSSRALYPDATYVCAADTFVKQGDTTALVPLTASRSGSFANRPFVDADPEPEDVELADNIFDRENWLITAREMAGGSDGATDDDIRRYARAYAQGQYGPTARATLAGAFRAGAKHAIVIDDPAIAAQRLYIGDQSWAGSTRWAKAVRQQLSDDKLVGFGCKVLVSYVTNRIISAEVVCKVRRPEYLTDTTSIDTAIQRTLRSYFDDRPDWNRWNAAALRGIVARADRRLLSCSSVTIKDLDGSPVAAPTTDAAVHYMLLANGVSGTYLSPT